MAFCLLEYVNHIEFHWLGNNPLIHEHSLDESDAIKRNSTIREHVQYDITKGYTPVAVISSIRGFGRSEVQALLNTASRTYFT